MPLLSRRHQDAVEHPGEPAGNTLRDAWARTVGRGQSTKTPTQAVIRKARGIYLHTVDGRMLHDWASGVLVCNLGHRHPGFERRWRQYRRDAPRSAYNLLTEVQIAASRRVVVSFGYAKAEKILWAASGSEGIQKAIWACQHRYPERKILVGTRGGFHGKKGLAGDVSGEESTNPNVRFISFPMHEPRPAAYYEEELQQLHDTHGGEIACVITEPYLGAAGSHHPPTWYHKLLADWCALNDVPLIFDEVQSCFGRTGNMYAFDIYGVQPDLVVLGKGLANGEPGAALVGRADLIDALDYGEASDTFSACPSACAAVCAAMDVIETNRVIENVRAMEGVMRRTLESLRNRFRFVRAIRGEGLVFGIEMTDPEVANQCVLEAYRGNGDTGVHFLGPLAQTVLRVSPPLIINRKQIDEAHDLLVKAWSRI